MKLHPARIFVGAAGRVTECLLELEPSDPPDVKGSLASWFCQCPGQSVAWQHYSLTMIHLRPIEGVKPPIIRRQGATHEVMLYALDPKPNPVPEDLNTWHFLRPVNYVGQMTLPSDQAAVDCLYHLARGVADGLIWAEPPLSGRTQEWDHQLRQLEDHAAGKHAN